MKQASAGSFAPGDTPWGEAFVDQSLASMWYGCDWATVEDEELVFLLPGLVGRRRDLTWPPEAPARLRRLLEQSLARELRLSSDKGLPGAAEQGSQGFLCLARWLERLTSAESQGIPVGEVPGEEPLAELLRGSLLSGINAAYLFSREAGSHQVFAAAAWLGYIARGRAAYLLLPIAEHFVDLLRQDEARLGAGDRLLRAEADRCIGRARLLRLSLRVLASGAAIRIKPLRKPLQARLRDRSWRLASVLAALVRNHPRRELG